MEGAGTPFDVLPRTDFGSRRTLQYFDVPTDLVLEVEIEHPEYSWFADLGGLNGMPSLRSRT